jgi:LacI family transcriptional regulator
MARDSVIQMKQAADQTGRQPLARPSGRLPIGWINAWSHPHELAQHPEYGGYWRGACEAASERGYHLEEFQLHPEITLRELEGRLRAKGFCGLLLPPEGEPAILNHFPWEKYHVVSLSHRTAAPAMNLVGPNRVGNCSTAFNMMRKRGYHRIGFLTDRRPRTLDDKLSVIGFLSTQCELPMEEQLPVFTTTGCPLPNQLSQWVACHRLDAILTDLPEADLLLKQAGFRIPQDLGLAFSCRSRIPDAAGIDCHPEEVGRIGVQVLTKAIDGDMKVEPRIRVAVTGHWREGNTLPVVLKDG